MNIVELLVLLISAWAVLRPLGIKETEFQNVPGSAIAPISLTENANGEVAVGTGASTQILAAAPTRRLVIIKNNTANTFRLAFGSAATATDIPLGAGESFTLAQFDGYMFVGAINAFQSSGGSLNINVLEFIG